MSDLACPSGSGSQASPEAPSDLRPAGVDPSRIETQPVAWMMERAEAITDDDRWVDWRPHVVLKRPSEQLWRRNIRPLYEHPPVAAAPVVRCPTVSIVVLPSDNSDYVVLAIKPKNEPVRRMRISKGGAEVLMAELSGVLTSANWGDAP